ncbi:MAG: hypothetical protein ACI915_004540, partial [Gammaproteobacteria bacterium]
MLHLLAINYLGARKLQHTQRRPVMIKLAVLLKRKRDMSFAAFDEYWLGPHG